jgi:predicted DNA binding CopG/RHH family protein
MTEQLIAPHGGTIAPLGQMTPEQLQALAAVDVLSQPTPDPDNEDVKVAEKIKSLQKGATFTMKLGSAELLKMEREAAATGIDWKTYMEKKIRETVLEGLVGRATISAPSAYGQRVSAPTGAVSRA